MPAASTPLSQHSALSPGHADGDEALSAWRLMLLIQAANFINVRREFGSARARRFGDELAALIQDLLPSADILPIGRATVEISFDGALPGDGMATIARLRSHFASPVEIDGVMLMLELTCAGAAMPNHDRDDVRLAEAAESAMAQARGEQRDIVRDLSRIDHSFDRLALMRDLPGAIVNGEVFLQYQPKVHLRQQKIVSVEALVRWQHPIHGLIPPGDFIPLTEESGKIAALTLWTIDRVIDDQRSLADAGHDIPIFINISGVLLADADFVEQACAMLRGTTPRIGFEITETAVIRDPESAIRHLHQFAEIGVTLAIDDYGAGLSSLAYLKQLPARELKIDKMFVLELTSSHRDPLIVRSTIDLAHALDMEVTAEGVETPAALALLSVMGCDMAQGFLISRPLTLGVLHEFLHEDRHLTATASMRPSFGRPESFWKRA